MLPQTTSVAELAYCLDQMGARRAIVTDGSTDAAILEDGVVWLQAPPSNTPAYRQTGAGDLLAGAAFRAFVAGHSFERSARLGMATACHLIDVNGLTESTLDAIAATEHAMVRSRTIAKT